MSETGTLTSSAVPKTPSGPGRTREIAAVVSRLVSSGSSKEKSTDLTKKRRAPSSTLTLCSTGGKVSLTTSKTTGALSVLLPPVSVTRTCTDSLLPPAAMVGVCAVKTKGNAGASATTTPSTSSSTLRTWTSSATVGRTVKLRPSRTCTPGVPGSASLASTWSDTTWGGTPLASKAT